MRTAGPAGTNVPGDTEHALLNSSGVTNASPQANQCFHEHGLRNEQTWCLWRILYCCTYSTEGRKKTKFQKYVDAYQ